MIWNLIPQNISIEQVQWNEKESNQGFGFGLVWAWTLER
jgi:hypothetical protein